jgi:uncharacterized RDD family membrane protein YckC
MSIVTIATPFNIDLELNVAGFGKRLLAWIIDTCIQTAYYFAYVNVVHSNLPYNSNLRMLSGLFLGALPLMSYHFLMEVFFNGQSIGKRAVGIRVVNFTGNRASISQCLIRLLFRSFGLVPLVVAILLDMLNSISDSAMWVWFFLILMLASGSIFLLYIFSKYGQRLGDRLANTLVIESRATADIHKTIYLNIDEQSYTVRYPEVMKLTDRDINGIRNLLDAKRLSKETEAYMQRIAVRIEEVLGIKSNQNAYDFLAQLLRDYNYLTSK